MNSKTKTWLGILSFIVFIGLAYFAYTALAQQYKPNNDLKLAEDTNQQIPEPIPAPDFTVYDVEGNEVKLSDFFGKPIVLNFWASWCPPCRIEMPHFESVYNQSQEDIVFMMVDMVDGQRETQEKGQKYISNQGFTFPVYFDLDQSAALSYGINSIPTTLFIDKEGNIITGYQGAIDEDTLNQALELFDNQ